jgi:hypothetical protein
MFKASIEWKRIPKNIKAALEAPIVKVQKLDETFERPFRGRSRVHAVTVDSVVAALSGPTGPTGRPNSLG